MLSVLERRLLGFQEKTVFLLSTIFFWLIQKDLLSFSLIAWLLKEEEKLWSNIFLIAKKTKTTLLISTLCQLIFYRREEKSVLYFVGLHHYFVHLSFSEQAAGFLPPILVITS